jgi:hypothetical protein
MTFSWKYLEQQMVLTWSPELPTAKNKQLTFFCMGFSSFSQSHFPQTVFLLDNLAG